MPAMPAVVGVSGAEVRAVERGSTGVLAPSESPVGQVSTSLPLGPPKESEKAADQHLLLGQRPFPRHAPGPLRRDRCGPRQGAITQRPFGPDAEATAGVVDPARLEEIETAAAAPA